MKPDTAREVPSKETIPLNTFPDCATE